VEIRTQIIKEDLVAFSVFNTWRSGNARFQLLLWAITPPLAVSSVAVWLTAGHLTGWVRLCFLLLVPVYFFVFYGLTKARLARKLDDAYNSALTQAELGEHSILLAEEGIHIAHNADTRYVTWTDIRRVIVNTNYGFIYTAADQAVIIPLRCFSNENDFALFMKMAVIYHWNNQRGSAQADAPVQPVSAKQPAASSIRPLAPIAMAPR